MEYGTVSLFNQQDCIDDHFHSTSDAVALFSFTSTTSADGCMFEIRAKDNPVLIEAFHVHMTRKTDNVAVYYRPGHVDYRYDDSYQLIYEAPSVAGAGKGLATLLPPFDPPVVVNPGTPITFYVSVTNNTSEGANLWYTEGEGSGTIMASDNNINVIEGMASGYPWKWHVMNRKWNGYVHYRLQPQPTSSPTESPISLSTSSPTRGPSTGSLPALQWKGVHGCTPTSPCDVCQGDCDEDEDCAGKLKCFKRYDGEYTQVPGCTVGGSADISGADYCYDPGSPTPTLNPTRQPSAKTPFPTDSIPSPTAMNPTASPVATHTGSPSGIIDNAGVVDAPTPTITIEPTTTESASTSTKTRMPSWTQAPNDPTDEPSLSPTGEESFPPTKTVTSLLPDFDPSSASSMMFNNSMGRICSYLFPLFITTISFL